MTYQWWMTHNEEEYFNPCETREEALTMAREEGYPVIAECLKGDFNLTVDADNVLQRLGEQNEENTNEDGDFIDCTRTQLDDLSAMLTETLRAWAVKHDIKTEAWAFVDIRNIEKVEPEVAAI